MNWHSQHTPDYIGGLLKARDKVVLIAAVFEYNQKHRRFVVTIFLPKQPMLL
jgi:hypothetical protein